MLRVRVIITRTQLIEYLYLVREEFLSELAIALRVKNRNQLTLHSEVRNVGNMKSLFDPIFQSVNFPTQFRTELGLTSEASPMITFYDSTHYSY